MTCSCIGSHDLGMIIAPRKPVMLPGDEEEDTARALDFDVVLGRFGGNSQRWDQMRVKLAEKDVISHSTPFSLTPEPPRKRLRWASSVFTRSQKIERNSAPTKVRLQPSSIDISETISPRSHITNLCQSLQKGTGLSSDCYGFVRGMSSEFGVYHHDPQPSPCGAITLRDVLEGRGETVINFGYQERLKLALTLSFGVLHLYNTPWLSQAITLDDVVFLHEEDTMGNETCYLDCPFLAKQLPKATRKVHAAPFSPTPSRLVPQQQPVRKGTERPIDSTILSLGLLLIQIVIGHCLENLHVDDGMTTDGMLEKKTSASKMAGLVLQNGGMNYEAAVQWCLENCLSVANLDNEGLAGQFHDSVIARLETDMTFQTMTFS